MTAGLFSLPLASADPPSVPLRTGRASITRSVSEGLVSEGTDSFGHFIAGPENALVRTLADAATSDPLTYNPIVLYGPIGVGKTSLAHVLAALRRDGLGLNRIIATTGSDLAGSLAHALETDGADDFRAVHHECDILLIDDVHQLAGKAAAQQFLLTAFDALVQRGSLVIATLRHLPQATDGLTGNLVSRLAAGLVAPLAMPSSLTRRELVRQAASLANLPINENVINELVGEDGAFSRLATPAQLRHAVLQLSLTNANSPARSRPQIDASRVCKQAAVVVARHSGLTLTELRGKSRPQAIADARGLAMYLSRQISNASYAEIGRHFGNRDHTTVLHACNKFTRRIAQDDVTRRLAAELLSQVSAACRTDEFRDSSSLGPIGENVSPLVIGRP